MQTEHTDSASAQPIRIDVHTPGEPISPYIYSQFIEHLGRCIYGGIWAEILEDRKFYEPVGSEASPWHVLGSPAGCCMDIERPYTGEHTPVVELSGNGGEAGLVQDKIPVEAGKEYIGRICLAGDYACSPVSVTLVWGSGPEERQTVQVGPLGEDFMKFPLRFRAGAKTHTARLEISSSGSGRFRVGAVSLMPADHVHGMRPDTLNLLRELNAPLYRWPGGNFVSGYDWRDGIGDADRRPPRKNPAWRGVEHNDFGIHEFLDFCALIQTEPLIVVNTGFGDSYSAAQELEYVNGTPDSPMGQWRAANGHRDPWKVVWWGIGNEMFGPWQLGFMAADQYVVKHRDFESRMRKVDPTIRTIGVGEAGPWSEAIMAGCGDAMDLVSEHFYCKDKDNVPEHVAQIPGAIRAKVEAHRRYRTEIDTLVGRDVRIAMDEWNYWYGPEPFGELGVRYFWKDALGIAAGLHEFYRQSDMVAMANYAQTVNVLGCIKVTPDAAAMETTGLVLKMYRDHFGVKPFPVHGASGNVDIAAAMSEDGSTLTVGVVNPNPEVINLALEIPGCPLSGRGQRWWLACDDPMAYNDPNDPPRVIIEHGSMETYSGAATVPGYSITILALDVAAS